MRPRSLRLRLVLGAAVWIAAALVLAGLAIAYLFTASAERGARADLSATMSRLVALIDPEAPGPAPVLAGALPDARYDTPMSGLYWQIEAGGGASPLRSRSLWDHVLDAGAERPGGHYATLDGPGGQLLLAFTLLARLPATGGERAYRLIVAQDRSILDAASRRFGRELAAALAILGAVLVAAAGLQVHLGLSPLRRLRRDVERVRAGGGGAALLGTDYPSEVRPLVGEVNALLASHEASMAFARSRAADLAHGLKTPLAVLGTLEATLAERGDQRSAALLAALTGEMRERIDYQLRLARLRQRTRLHSLSAPLGRVLSRAIAVLRRTEEGERLDWRIEVEEGLDADIDANDLVELVGVLLENAAKWAESLVAVEARRAGADIELRIGDDGPGIAEAALVSLGTRGRRLDETTPGTGLGLAIAREILALNGGSIAFGRAAEGGLAVTIRLPGAGAASDTV